LCRRSNWHDQVHIANPGPEGVVGAAVEPESHNELDREGEEKHDKVVDVLRRDDGKVSQRSNGNGQHRPDYDESLQPGKGLLWGLELDQAPFAAKEISCPVESS